MNGQILTPQQCHILLVKASSYDGRGTGTVETGSWHDAATLQRWTSLELGLAAIVDYYSRPAKQGERLWIMPGHITEYIRANMRQPQPFEEQRRELEGPPPASDEAKAAAIQDWADRMARRKSPPRAEPVAQVDDVAAARAVAEEARRARWAAVDGCTLCDREGLVLGAGGVAGVIVCDHEAAVPTSKSGLDEDEGPDFDHRVAV